MRACEADRCEHGATVNGRWCERHDPLPEIRAEIGPPEYALEADTVPDPVVEEILADKRARLAQEWRFACESIEDAEGMLTEARTLRRKVLGNMQRTGMSLADIAEVTGLTRQRIGQLLKP